MMTMSTMRRIFRVGSIALRLYKNRLDCVGGFLKAELRFVFNYLLEKFAAWMVWLGSIIIALVSPLASCR